MRSSTSWSPSCAACARSASAAARAISRMPRSSHPARSSPLSVARPAPTSTTSGASDVEALEHVAPPDEAGDDRVAVLDDVGEEAVLRGRIEGEGESDHQSPGRPRRDEVDRVARREALEQRRDLLARDRAARRTRPRNRPCPRAPGSRRPRRSRPARPAARTRRARARAPPTRRPSSPGRGRSATRHWSERRHWPARCDRRRRRRSRGRARPPRRCGSRRVRRRAPRPGRGSGRPSRRGAPTRPRGRRPRCGCRASPSRAPRRPRRCRRGRTTSAQTPVVEAATSRMPMTRRGSRRSAPRSERSGRRAIGVPSWTRARARRAPSSPDSARTPRSYPHPRPLPRAGSILES